MNKPKIRFKGFEGEWENTPLLDVVTLYNGLTYTPNDIRDHGTLVLRSSNVQEGEISLLDNVYVRSEVATSSNVKKGDIIVVVRNGSRTLIGKHAQIKSDMPHTVIGAFMAGMHTDEPEFLNALLCTSRFDNEVTINLGATINQITNGTFHSMKFLLPDKKEQRALGSYFQHLDSLIQSTTKKIESLKQVKAASLQSMFPQEGETTPRVRFKGFEGEWEDTTIGKVTSVKRGVRVTRKNLRDHGLYPVYQNTDYPMGYYNRYNVESNNPFVIIGGSAGLIGFCDKDFWAADDCAYFSDNVKLDKSYLYSMLLNKSSEIKKNVRGSSVPRLDRQVINDLNILLPSIKEQRAIASYFTSLDRQITLHTQRLEKLKQIKAACLDKMFV